MSILNEIRALDPSRKNLRSFGLLVGGIFAAIAVFLFVKGGGTAVSRGVLGGIGAVLVVGGALAPALLKPLYYAWMSFAVVLGFVMTRVLLTIFFVLVLTPVGLLFRLLGRDPLKRAFDRGAATYWETKEYPIADRSRYEKFF